MGGRTPGRHGQRVGACWRAPGLPHDRCHRLGGGGRGLTQQKFIISFWRPEVHSQVMAGLRSLQRLQERTLPASSGSLWTPGLPGLCLVPTRPSSARVFPSARGLLLCAWVFASDFPLFIRVRGHPTAVGPCLNRSHLQAPCFQIKPHSRVLGRGLQTSLPGTRLSP